jgi:hypothetical protein
MLAKDDYGRAGAIYKMKDIVEKSIAEKSPTDKRTIDKNFFSFSLYEIALAEFTLGKKYDEVLAKITSDNSQLVEPLNAEDIQVIMNAAVNGYDPPQFLNPTDIITLTHRDNEVMVFQKGTYEFLFTNIVVNNKGKLKASLTLSKDCKYVIKDEISPSIKSQREKFIKAADDPGLEQLLVELEALIRKQIEVETKEAILKAKQAYIMTAEERSEAERFICNTPNILAHMIEATNRMGVVGEERLRLMVYLCFVSRILKDPLSMTVKGESSSGKSFSCQSVMRLIPEEGYHFITRATANAFFHLPEDGLQHKIVYINEIQGSEQADYSIRTAQSEGDLILMMPIKDPNTGNMETITKRVKGPVGFLITTTKAQMFDENETRNFSVFSDDSPNLTQRIGEITVRKAMGESFILDHKEINLWRNMQRLLKSDLRVVIPYAQEVLGAFPDKPVRIRRDRERFRILIEVITMLHQYHREKKGDQLVSTLADYHLAREIAGQILAYTIFEQNPAAEELWATLLNMQEKFVPQEDAGPEFTFTYKDIAHAYDWKVEKVKKWIYSLHKNGIIDYVGGGFGGKGGRGQIAIMKLTVRGMNFSPQEASFLPKVADLRDKYPCNEELIYDPFKT